MNKNSNTINWPPITILIVAMHGFKPFVGYWVRIGDDKLYTLNEVWAGEYPAMRKL